MAGGGGGGGGGGVLKWATRGMVGGEAGLWRGVCRNVGGLSCVGAGEACPEMSSPSVAGHETSSGKSRLGPAGCRLAAFVRCHLAVQRRQWRASNAASLPSLGQPH